MALSTITLYATLNNKRPLHRMISNLASGPAINYLLQQNILKGQGELSSHDVNKTTSGRHHCPLIGQLLAVVSLTGTGTVGEAC